MLDYIELYYVAVLLFSRCDIHLVQLVCSIEEV